MGLREAHHGANSLAFMSAAPEVAGSLVHSLPEDVFLLSALLSSPYHILSNPYSQLITLLLIFQKGLPPAPSTGSTHMSAWGL